MARRDTIKDFLKKVVFPALLACFLFTVFKCFSLKTSYRIIVMQRLLVAAWYIVLTVYRFVTYNLKSNCISREVMYRSVNKIAYVEVGLPIMGSFFALRRGTMLSVSDLTVWYVKEKNILQEVNFSLDNHIVIGLLGINGSGKTTLINFLSGVHKHYSVQTISYNNAAISIKDAAFKADRYTVFTEEQAFSYLSSYLDKVDLLRVLLEIYL